MPGPEGAQLIQQLADIVDQLGQLGYSQDSLDQLQSAAANLATENETASYSPGQDPSQGGQPPVDAGVGAAPPAPIAGNASGGEMMGDPKTMDGAKQNALASFASQGHFGKPGGAYDDTMKSVNRKKKGVGKAK